MKIRLAVGEEERGEIARFLAEHGIETDEEAEYILLRKSRPSPRLPVREVKSGEKTYLSSEDVIYAESFGHDVFLHTKDGIYQTGEPLYRIERLLDGDRFVRVSASVLVAHAHIRHIRPTLSRKYVLTLSDGAVVDVTRTYYEVFRERFGL